MERIFQTIFGALGAIAGFIWGGLDGMIIALLICIILDYITGCLVGISQKKLSSQVGFKGICKKVAILILVGLAHILDVYILKTGSILRSAVSAFYIANEGISILENCGNLGLPIPKKLKEVLAQLKNEEKDETTE